MTPEFNPSNILSDTVNQAKERGSSALVWGAALLALVAVVAFGKKRR